MRMSRKRWIRFTSVVMVLGSLGLMSLSERLEAATLRPIFRQQQTPITLTKQPLIMVPGTGGTIDRFDGLIQTLQQTTDSSVIKVQVNTDETVTTSGKLRANTQPLIVIAFEDPSDRALPLQGKWYQIGLAYLKKQYSFDTYTFLGHSNGGLVLTQYLEDQYTTADPKLVRAMTLGTPFNDMDDRYNANQITFDTPQEYSAQLTNYLANQTRIPELDFLNVIGDTGEATDDVVEMTSVLAGRLLYQDRGDYQEKIITSDAQHSALVENLEVVDLIHHFLWQENK